MLFFVNTLGDNVKFGIRIGRRLYPSPSFSQCIYDYKYLTAGEVMKRYEKESIDVSFHTGLLVYMDIVEV